MTEGLAALEAPNKTTAELQQSLQAIKLKYRMDELNGLLLKEEAAQYTWTLKGKLGDNAVTQQVLREPSKAENEEQVNEEDRAKHEAMAQEIESKLKAITATEGEDFATFRARLQAEADKLKMQYQPQLREGINLTIELVNSAKEDEKDGDVDVRVEIKPNATSNAIKIYYKEEEQDIIKEFKWPGLGKDENDFGSSHTMEKHIGLSQSELKRRIREENLVVASTFINYGIANSAVLDIINSNILEIENWYNNTSKGLLTLKMNIGDVIGYYFTVEQLRVPIDATKAMIVLNRNSDVERPFYVLTAFPYESNVEKKLRKQYGY